ncbi:MFS transporter [Ammoniphilus oxalaticus]|uniref:MFS transporter n=1 Tax=Ammoniphilus oxalaticus TaxID=66863 RepID=A0A419SNM1_9BACL|nr:MFS transporter [Ammoniphilus oxalaticus]RKD25888.1 MFS transporter [Ammoniphilus oxalaticus]
MNKMLKPTIISIGMATVMAGAAISPALGLIAQEFPTADPVLIKLILTAPSLMIIPFSFLCSYLTTKITKKSLLMAGLVIYLLSGVGAQFMNSIESLLAFRLALGAGVGLVMPLSMSLISDYFTGEERTQMMGYNSAFSNFGGIVTMMLAGYLATFGWRVPFNVYFIGLIIMILVFFFLPRGTVEKRTGNQPRKKIPLVVYGYAVSMGGVMLVYYSIATNMALYMEQNNLGGAGLAGTVISFTTVGGMTTSILLVRLQGLLKNYIIPITLLVMGIAFSILSLMNNLPLVFISVCLIGFGQGILFPVLLVKVINAVEPQQSDRAIAITSSMIFIGQFLSPILLNGIGRLVGMPTIRFEYGAIAVGLGIAIVFTFISVIRSQNSNADMQEAAS